MVFHSKSLTNPSTILPRHNSLTDSVRRRNRDDSVLLFHARRASTKKTTCSSGNSEEKRGDAARSQPLIARSAKSFRTESRIEETESSTSNKVRGTVVLMKKNVLDFNDLNASILDRFHELVGRRVSLKLVSSVYGDPDNGMRGKVGKAAYLEHWITTISPLTAGDSAFEVNFDWDAKNIGIPGAFIIRNEHHSEFFLKSLTLKNVPGRGRVHFVCNSWVYPADKYKTDRVFFTNKSYLPSQTPVPLRKYREEELMNLRGNGKGELQEWDRVYDYAYYNDLGNPDKGPKYARPILGGSAEYPYPRRGRTGRPATKTDPKVETRLNLLLSLNIYAPRDERFGHVKLSDFLAYALKSIGQFIKPEVQDIFDSTRDEFDSFEDVLKLYDGGVDVPEGLLKSIRDNVPAEIVKEIFRSDGEKLLKFPIPQVIKEDKNAWSTDEEFAREMLAGINPAMIRRLQEFPPKSKLDQKVYGDQTSKITKEHIEPNLNGLTVEEAIKSNKVFILDHHDTLMPFLRRINSTSTKTYATRTLLFLQENGTLKPIAIELSLPHPKGDKFGFVSEIYKPSNTRVDSSIWQIAKAYVAVNDSGYHQLVSHWLHTHAVMEPFVIATNRQLSVAHPIHKLLHPHFRDTMNLNAVARQILINGGGALEFTVFPGKYSLEMTSACYKDWVFPDEALPRDLIKRGMAVEDKESEHGVRLVIEDYPYAVDGLEIWSAIKTWVSDYVSLYYESDEAVRTDSELQSWWTEVRSVGHGDLSQQAWWPELRSRSELSECVSTIIWIASALHAAVNFGQYPYGGFPPNRPAASRRLMPGRDEVARDPQRAFLGTFPGQLLSVLGISLVEVLSRHSADEVYLGERPDHEWTEDADVAAAFQRFGARLREVERRIEERNQDARLANRVGPVKMPYTLLYPSSEGGLTGKGIPNSVSI